MGSASEVLDSTVLDVDDVASALRRIRSCVLMFEIVSHPSPTSSEPNPQNAQKLGT